MENYRFDKDEFDLIEFARVILRRKKTVFNIILICVIISSIVGILTSETSEVYAIVRIGTVSKPLISSKQALYEIRSKEILDTVINVLKLAPYAYNFNNMISAEAIQGTDLIKIKVKHTNASLSTRICNVIATAFVAKNNFIYDEELRLLKEEIEEIKTRRFVTDAERFFLLEKDAFVAKNNFIYDEELRLLKEEIEEIKTRRFVTDAERFFLLEKDAATAKNFAVMEQSRYTEFDSLTNLGYKICVAMIFGLMLSFFIILIQEFSCRDLQI